MSDASLSAISTFHQVCPGCQHRGAAKFLGMSGPYDLYLCHVCELTFSDPMRAADSDFYEANTEYDDKWEFKVTSSKVKQLGLGGSLLDIGCGDGRLMKMLEEHFSVTGLDFNARAVDIAKSERGLSNVYPITIEEFIGRFPAAKFDLITVFHVLEHVEDPNKFVASIKKCLKPDGIVAVSVPNVHRWTLRWTREIWDYPPHHLTRWTPANLCTLLERQGFIVIEICSETIVTLSQVRDAFRDILWASVFEHFSFGVTARLDASLKQIGVSRGNLVGKSVHAVLVLLRSIFVRGKGKVIQLLSSSLALATYGVFWFGKYEGKSVLVLARARKNLK